MKKDNEIEYKILMGFVIAIVIGAIYFIIQAFLTSESIFSKINYVVGIILLLFIIYAILTMILDINLFGKKRKKR